MFFDEFFHLTDNSLVDKTEYRAMIGVLLFLFRQTRSDISSIIEMFSQFCSRPTIFCRTASNVYLAISNLLKTLQSGLIFSENHLYSISMQTRTLQETKRIGS